jgi:hypothetical protein
MREGLDSRLPNWSLSQLVNPWGHVEFSLLWTQGTGVHAEF